PCTTVAEACPAAQPFGGSWKSGDGGGEPKRGRLAFRRQHRGVRHPPALPRFPGGDTLPRFLAQRQPLGGDPAAQCLGYPTEGFSALFVVSWYVETVRATFPGRGLSSACEQALLVRLGTGTKTGMFRYEVVKEGMKRPNDYGGSENNPFSSSYFF